MKKSLHMECITEQAALQKNKGHEWIERLCREGIPVKELVSALHEVSPSECAHSKRVSELCAMMGRSMGMTNEEIRPLRLSGLLHDVGKIAVCKTILDKPDRLTNEEFEEMMLHPQIGYRILSASSQTAHIAEFVLFHHERLDGRGYPRGLTDKEIPLQSKILAVADSYDAMVSDRPYRKAMPLCAAIEELQVNTGTQFDPTVVSVLLDYLLAATALNTVDNAVI